MLSVHMTEAEVASDFHAVIEKVRQGIEVVIDRGDHPVAVIAAPKPNRRSGRPILEILEESRKRNSNATLDTNFGKDMEDVIASHHKPWNPPSWD